LFCMAVVFAVLGILWGIIRVFSIIIMRLEKRSDKSANGTNP
jgi:Na+-transporting methylmalonyl-CoA/oxaloacetate decarboxylase gamma subunit